MELLGLYYYWVFAILLMVEGPWNQLAKLEDQVPELQAKLDLTITTKRTEERAQHRRDREQAKGHSPGVRPHERSECSDGHGGDERRNHRLLRALRPVGVVVFQDTPHVALGFLVRWNLAAVADHRILTGVVGGSSQRPTAVVANEQ